VGTQSSPSATPPQQPRPTFRTEANFVRVDVYPTAGGKAVTDLAASRVVVVIAHDLDEAWPVTRRIRLESGRIVEDRLLAPVRPDGEHSLA